MLTASLLPKRTVVHVCRSTSVFSGRFYSNKNNGGRRKDRSIRRTEGEEVKSNAKGSEDVKDTPVKKEPSLFEQLFPDRAEEERLRDEKELPRIPPERTNLKYDRSRPIASETGEKDGDVPVQSKSAKRLEQQMRQQGRQTSVLVLRNASKNLVEEDFRRLVPQGQHLEGWKLEQSDILKIIPGRNLATLEQENYYYMFFSSPLGAFTYQGHATRIHRIVAGHSPASILSPLPPPPGYMLQGMDAHSAIQAFTLVPPTQSLSLRQLRPPHTPMMEAIIRHGGYPEIINRKDRMPHEARLTLEGLQLHINPLRHILRLSAEARRLKWSGGEEEVPILSKWKPIEVLETASPMSNKPHAVEWAFNRPKFEDEQSSVDPDQTDPLTQNLDEVKATKDGNGKSEVDESKRRTPLTVFIAGFHTERAMQSFIQFWHKRPMTWEGFRRIEDGDLPPITNVEVLW